MSTLRENVFKKRKPRSVTIRPSFLADSDTPDVEVRVMTIRARSDMITESTQDDGERDSAVFIARLVIETAFVPGTEDKVFARADQEALAELPSDVLDELAEPALRINGLMIGAVQAAEKN